MTLALKLMSIFWVTSPAWYLVACKLGYINHPYDVYIWFALCGISWFVGFMNQKWDLDG